MNAQVVVLAAVTVLLLVSAGRGFSVRSRNTGHHQLDAGDGTGMKRVPEESDVSNQDLDAGDLVLVEERAGNDLHDIRRREAGSKKRSSKRQGESGDGSGMDEKRESSGKVLVQEISDFLEPKKEMIMNFMRPIIDRIKHRPKKPSPESSSDLPTSQAPTTPAPSSTPPEYDGSTPSESDTSSSSDYDTSTPPDSDDSTPSDSDTSTPSEYDASAPSDSDTSTPSDSTNSDATTPPSSSSNLFPFFPFSFSKCGANERHRNVNTLSLLFPDSQSDKGEQPFVFLPLTNTLMRVVEQQIIGESRSGVDSRRNRHD